MLNAYFAFIQLGIDNTVKLFARKEPPKSSHRHPENKRRKRKEVVTRIKVEQDLIELDPEMGAYMDSIRKV